MDDVTRLQLASEDSVSVPKSKAALVITGDNLEDLLAYDDLFLDYFNYFLALPVFSQAVVYNRLTGAFDKFETRRHELSSVLSSNSTPVQYGPTDAERDSMLEWARKERLPLFLRTQLFRELKILKLLLRPLDNRSASRNSSRNLRGYSRGTESYTSSLSVSGDNNSGHDVCEEDIWGEPHYSALYRYQRPGSRALSLPTMTLFASAATLFEKTSKPPTAATSHKSEEDVLVHFSESCENIEHLNHTILDEESGGMTTLAARSELRKFNGAQRNNAAKDSTEGSKIKSSIRSRAATSSTEDAFLRGARVLSAPVNFEEFLKMPRFNISDLDAIFGGPTFIQFDKEGFSEEQTETDIRRMEGRLKMSIQQVKETVLGSRRGFERFCKFLKGTAGEHLLTFWLECENFKDCMEDFDDSEIMAIRHIFFRNMQDKFKLKLTADAVEQINRAANNSELSYNIFLRTQYDVLRRLRAYWVPRFIIHCEMTQTVRLDKNDEYKSSLFPSLYSGSHSLVSTIIKPSEKNPLPFFPSISLVHSIPALPEDITDYANKLLINTGDNNLPRIWGNLQSPTSASSNKQIHIKLPSKERFLLAMSSDKLAGGPFRRYLASHNDPQLLSCLLFWEDVTQYGIEEDSLSDRLLKLCHAWNIYKKYLSDDSPCKIELPEGERKQLLANLETARDYIKSSIFEDAKAHAMEKLESAWMRYLKEDLKAFLDCRVRFEDDSPPSTAEVIEITLTEHDVVIKRPMPWVRRIPGSTATERGQRLNKALVTAEETEDDEPKAQKKMEATSRKKEMERERKRIIKAAYAKQREMKLKRPSLGSEYDELPERNNVPRAAKLPTYQNLTGNKQLMTIFRKFISEGENDNKDIFNKVQLHTDIEAYFSLKDPKLKKAKATAITKLYLDSQSKRSVQLNNENLTVHVTDEKDQPKPELLQEIHKSILPEIEDVFQNFVLMKADDLNVSPKDLVTMSQSELTKCVESEQAMILALNKRKSRGKTTGRAQATREDRNEFLACLNQCATGHLTMPMLYFYKYLLKHGEADGMPQIDKNLFFYIEVQKFKDGSHNFADDEILRRKLQSIVECFLDSACLPTLQIDIPAEMHQKTMKAAQRYLNGKDVNPSLFDDAQLHVFRELLFYWAGFKKSLSASDDLKKRPVNKHDKMLKRRFERIQNYQAPSTDFTLPTIPEGSVPFFSFSLSEGLKFKDLHDSFAETPVSDQVLKQQQSKKNTLLESDGQAKQSRELSRRESLVAR